MVEPIGIEPTTSWMLRAKSNGLPYADFERFFDEMAFDSGGNRSRRWFWPTECQEDPRWERLAPRKFRQPQQINEPLK